MPSVRKHPNYVLGFSMWILSLVFVIFAPKFKIFKRGAIHASDYTKFVNTLSLDQRTKLASLEAGLLKIDNKYYYIDETNDNEFVLRKNNKINYKSLTPVIDETIKRSIIFNSLLKSMQKEERDQVLMNRAVILYRNNEFILIYGNYGKAVENIYN